MVCASYSAQHGDVVQQHRFCVPVPNQTPQGRVGALLLVPVRRPVRVTPGGARMRCTAHTVHTDVYRIVPAAHNNITHPHTHTHTLRNAQQCDKQMKAKCLSQGCPKLAEADAMHDV